MTWIHRSTGLRWRIRGLLGAVGLLLVAAGPAMAADSDETESDSETQLWLRYQFQRRVTDRWRGFGMLRYEEVVGAGRLFGAQQRFAITGGATYSARDRLRLEGGLGLYDTIRPDQPDIFETRLWQAATVDWPDSFGGWRRWVLHHRFMLEERFKKTTDWDFELRLRYRLAFSLPVTRYTIEPGALYAPLAAEFFFADDSGSQEIYTARQRFTAGLGYVLDKTWSVEARYTAQLSRDTVSGSFHVADHILDLRLKTSVRIRDLVKDR